MASLPLRPLEAMVLRDIGPLGGWPTLDPLERLGGLPLRFRFLQGWGILTNLKVPGLADTVLSRGIQATYKLSLTYGTDML